MTDVPRDSGPAPQSPDGLVAERITSDLVAEGLLDESTAKGFAARLASGAVTAGDWRLLADLGNEEEGGEAVDE